MSPQYVDDTWKRALAEARRRRTAGEDECCEPVLNIFARLVRADVRREAFEEAARLCEQLVPHVPARAARTLAAVMHELGASDGR